MADLSQRISELSPEKLALLVRRMDRKAPPAAAGGSIPRRRPGDPEVLSLAQERLWFLDQLDPGNAAYNVSVTARLEGFLSLPRLQRALDEILCRHEALRTAIVAEDGRPCPRVSPSGPFPLGRVDLSGLPSGPRQAELRRLASEEALRPFDLASAPLIRGLVLALDAGDAAVCLTMHHIVSDGWSLGVLLREVGMIYEALGRGEPLRLPELPVQYLDYALWQRRWLQGETLERQVGYWRRQLAGSTTEVELPADRPRTSASYEGGTCPLVLGAALSRQVRELARRQGVTVFTSILAAFEALVQRYTGQDDFNVGAPVSGRNQIETEGLVGLFVNTLVLRADLGGRPTFREHLQRVHRVILEAFSHQDVPFQRLVEELHPERDLGRSPFFQVMVNRVPLGRTAVPGFRLHRVERERWTSRMDLILFLFEGEDELTLDFEHSLHLFDPPTVRRIAEHFRNLLAAAVATPDACVAGLPLMADGERHQVLVEWNDRAAPVPRQTIHRLFEEQAARRPDEVALEDGGASLSYGELNRRANRLARHLRDFGVGAEVPVAFCLERSAQAVVTILAILKAGGAYVPLDPSHPTERLAALLADTGSPLVIADTATAGLLPPSSPVLVDLDRDRETISGHSGEDLPGGSGPDGLAYVLHTSGSTGRPKGVAVTHRNVIRLVHGVDYVRLGPQEVFLLLAPLAFDASTLELWGSLLHGGRLAVFPARVPALETLARTLDEHGVTTLWLTAGLFHQMEAAAGPRESLRRVRQLVAGGDVLAPGAVRRLLEDGGQVLINGYGPTEGTTFTCCNPMRSASEVGAGVPIGRPIANTRAHVLDTALEPVPVGVPGELYAGGEGVSRGYLRQPDRTAERFVPDPFGGVPGARLYRTGDRARLLPDGRIEFLGRVDRQVKIRGFRIEPGEIEAALARHPEVADAVVVARKDRRNDLRLAAYVVPRSPELPDLRAFLRAHLPEAMVPSSFVRLDALPLTPAGKIDRGALPRVEPEAERGEVREAPRTPVEELLAGIWADLLGRDAVGLHDDFFELGGHSLLATQAVSRIRETLGIEIPLRDFFEDPTVAGLARRAGAMRRGETLPPIVPIPRGGDLPLSSAQRRLWFLAQLDPESPAYNISTALRLRGRLAPDALRASLAEIARRHEVLRTVFTVAGGEPAARVTPPAPQLLPVIDLTGLSGEARRAELARRLREEVRRPFDLGAGPLWRATLFRLAREEHAAALSLHHIAGDGWSMDILVRELREAYASLVRGESPALPALPVQYADYAAWQQSWLPEVLDRQIAYWRERLGETPPVLELPFDHPRRGWRSDRGAVHGFALGPDLAEAVSRLAREERVTPFMVLLAAFQTLLARYTGQGDVSVGTPVAGRDRAEVEPLLGFFVNTLVMRASLADDPPFREALRRTREAALEAWAHQHLPFDKVVEELHPERSRGGLPLLQVMFALQEEQREALELPGLVLEPLAPADQPDRGTAKFELMLTLVRRRAGLAGLAGLAGEIEFSLDLFDPATVARLSGHLGTLLAASAAASESRLSDLPLLTGGERRQIAEWGTSESDFPHDLTLSELFEIQAGRSPEAPALDFADAMMTYRELAEQSTGLAGELRQRGVRRGDLVGLCATASADFVVGALAILKAGGAYVPLDPSYPREHLAFMVEDAGFPLILAQPDAGAALPAGSPVVLLGGRRTAAAPPAAAGHALDLAYVIYTSGSTGRPKGVAVPQRAVARLVLGADYVRLDPGERIGHASTVSFDAATFEIWGALLTGGCVVEVPRDAVLSPRRLALHLEETGITTLFLTTALFNQVAREEPGAFRGLRHLLFGGEAVDPMAVRRVIAHGPPERLLHVYGPTETTTFALWHPVTGVAQEARTVPIGRPIANTRLHLLDAGMQPVPAGVPGEVFLAGHGVARGYLNRPDLTAERFVPDPLGLPGGRLYRTGDLGRFRPEGALEFLGRTDQQIKLRGFRIEPGEIESRLALHPSVREAAVVVQLAGELAGEKDRRLIACVVPAPGETPDEAALRSFLGAGLPEYMVPSAFVVLEALPLTPSGKIDRRSLGETVDALPAPRGAAGLPADPSRSPLEEALAGLWADVLGVESVGVHDDFFTLGGHSLLATRLLSRLQEIFGASPSVADFFDAPTVAGQAAALEAILGQSGGAAPPPPIPTQAGVDAGTDAPLSFAQERLWFLQRVNPDSSAYNMPVAVHLRGPLDAPLLARTLSEVVRRHAVLRTVFPTVDGQPRQRTLAARPLPLPLVDLSGLAARAEPEARRLAAEEAARPFDLLREPPLRALLARVGEQDHLTLLTLHHIAGDGASMEILAHEVREIHGALRRGAPLLLPELPVQYADYAAWQREWLQGEALEARLDWWRERLRGADPDLGLPRRSARPVAGSRRAVGPTFAVSGETLRSLEALGRREGSTLFMTLLAAFQALLYRFGGREDLSIGIPAAGRHRSELRGLIGLFVNLLVVRTDLSGDPDFREVLRRVRASALGVYAHQDVPYQILVKEARRGRDASASSLFQAAFSLEEAQESPTLHDLEIRSFGADGDGDAKFELMLVVRRSPDGLSGALIFDRNVFDARTIQRLTRAYPRLLEAAASDPGVRLLDVALDDDAEPAAAAPVPVLPDGAEEFHFEL